MKEDLSRWIASLRREAPESQLEDADVAPNPIDQFRAWMQEAVDAGLTFPNAMTLATATAEGLPSARILLLKGIDERGFVFFTNYESRKGRELAENPRAALVFHWQELGRQVRVEGEITALPSEESEAYFRGRPRGSRLAAWASRQSQVIPSRRALEERFADLATAYHEQDIPLPPFWGGYLLTPQMIELWQARRDRLHDRVRYRKDEEGGWLRDRLAP
jgi:pyridoxamine 5'-phosphate oxidase